MEIEFGSPLPHECPLYWKIYESCIKPLNTSSSPYMHILDNLILFCDACLKFVQTDKNHLYIRLSSIYMYKVMKMCWRFLWKIYGFCNHSITRSKIISFEEIHVRSHTRLYSIWVGTWLIYQHILGVL